MAALATILDIGTHNYEHVWCPAVSHQVSVQSAFLIGAIGTALAHSTKFHGIRPQIYIEDLL